MLLRYSVSNFKSIGNNIEFSMLPSEDTSDDRFLIEIDTVVGKWKVLKRGAFFGPNASGKTSFIDSISYAKDYITKGPKNPTVTKVNQFKGNISELDGVTSFQFLIYVDKQVYNYGFSLDRSYVHEEWLAILNSSGNFDLLFDRKTTPKLSTKITVFDAYGKPESIERGLAELLTKSIKGEQSDQLFLFKLYENASTHAGIVLSWFKTLQIIYPNTKLQALPIKIQKDEQFRDFLSEKLHSLDTGVDRVSTTENILDLSDFEEKYGIPSEVIHEIEELQNGMISLNGKFYIFKEGIKRKITLIQIKFEHSLNRKKINFDIDDESDGTQRLLDLLPILFRLDNNYHNIYIVDELDRSLHTKLTKYLVNSIGNASYNTQFLFTTHDVNLLSLKNFRQDEIWFIEKNKNGETRLKPFSDFDVKNKENILKDYLTGRFGAVPVIKEGV